MGNGAADDSMTAAVTAAVMDAIAARDLKLSDEQRTKARNALDLERTAKRFTSVKEVVIAIGFFGTLIGGGAVALTEIQAKPSEAEMHEAIDEKVDPVIKVVTPMQTTVTEIENDLDRVQDVQAIQLEQSDWQVEVANCRANKACKDVPSEPETLKTKKRELITH